MTELAGIREATPLTYPYASAVDPLPWMDEAICVQVDMALFHSDEGDTWSARDAKRVCAGCPVTEECLKFGLNDRYGIYGGLTPRERQKLRRPL